MTISLEVQEKAKEIILAGLRAQSHGEAGILTIPPVSYIDKTEYNQLLPEMAAASPQDRLS